ncbi:MAG: acetylglutamate kinase [Calothrix sp. SM1_5_4]|nr:acetylglutamate kinase [Calothrix sp. SM1_5_4]
MEVVLVHGGGPAINRELRERGIEWTFIGGQRVTTPEMMSVIEATLAGQVNGDLLNRFDSDSLPVIGLSGADHGILLCAPQSAELGLVGRILQVNPEWIEKALAIGTIPVIAPLGGGSGGERYNINADWAASHIAAALNADTLLFLTDQPGILDPDGAVIPAADSRSLRDLIDSGTVSGGMLTKVLAVLHALSHGVREVRITDARRTAGTRCLTARIGERRPMPRFESMRFLAGEVALADSSNKRGIELSHVV